MPRNIEIKARLSNADAERIRALAHTMATRPSEHLHQTDTFYRATTGRLKLRRFEDGTAELIGYERADAGGPTGSSYVRAPAADPERLHDALAMSLGVRGVVEKRREVIHLEQTRVHVDDVAGLGMFLELEVVLSEGQSDEEAAETARGLMAAFGLTPDMLVEAAYIDLILGGEAAATART